MPNTIYNCFCMQNKNKCSIFLVIWLAFSLLVYFQIFLVYFVATFLGEVLGDLLGVVLGDLLGVLAVIESEALVLCLPLFFLVTSSETIYSGHNQLKKHKSYQRDWIWITQQWNILKKQSKQTTGSQVIYKNVDLNLELCSYFIKKIAWTNLSNLTKIIQNAKWRPQQKWNCRAWTLRNSRRWLKVFLKRTQRKQRK